MTAGGGILHIETPPEALVLSGGLFHGLQLWVNLPSRDKMIAPRYQSLEGGQVKLVSSADGGALVRIVAGDVAGHEGPGDTHTPISFVHATLAPGARLRLPWQPDFNALAYVMGGSGKAGPEGAPVAGGQLAIFGAGGHLELTAGDNQDSGSPALEVILLGGRPIGEPVAAYGLFVMNTKAEVLQAYEDFQAGRFGTIPPGALMPYAGPGRR
jgi:redox-sensitive bicupin YhaK (pirin superfamily)